MNATAKLLCGAMLALTSGTGMAQTATPKPASAAPAASATPQASGAPATPQPSALPPVRWTIIHAGTLMADASKPVTRNMSVILKNDKVDAIKPGFIGADAVAGAKPETVKIVELGDKFVMAGLIDAHVHLGIVDWNIAFGTAKKEVMEGTTTVRDAGSLPEIIFPLRKAIDQKLILGPRILAAGAPLTTTGGHGDMRNGNFQASLQPPAATYGVCDGVDQCIAKARQQILLGADQIKVMATAGVTDNSNTGLEQQFTDEELRAIVTATHLMKRKVMAHAIGTEGIKAAVRAGVDSIEHGNYLDDEGAELMKLKGTVLVPTLTAPAEVLRKVRGTPKPGDFPLSQNTRDKVLAMPEAQPGGIGRQVKIAIRHGVTIAVGTDFGGSVSDEMVLLVQDGGMTPVAALKAATVTNAQLLGVADKVGTLEPGKSADIVAFDGDPTKDITASKKITFVMAEGQTLKGPGAPQP